MRVASVDSTLHRVAEINSASMELRGKLPYSLELFQIARLGTWPIATRRFAPFEIQRNPIKQCFNGCIGGASVIETYPNCRNSSQES